MSVFGNIVSAIFGHSSATPAGGAAVVPSASASTAAPAPKGAVTASGVPAAGKPMTREQVEAMIEKIADAQEEEYNWEELIVDLMKLLKLDSSLSARKQLARELGYTRALTGSAEMNIWLHKQVMTKLVESGGVVPESLKRA